MAYELIIPARFLAAFAAGEISLMSTAAGATTTLVMGGQIVGVATLAEVGGTATASVVVGAGGAGAAGAGAVAASTLVWPVVIAVTGVALIGTVVWWLRRAKKARVVQADTAFIRFESTSQEATEALRRAQAIVDAEYSQAIDAPRVEMRGTALETRDV
ncbi:hypothetical protein E0H75_41430 [Kribbella capetownensis]|uniref:Transmembrane protein n=1 Tax=Kribbella capetownensis TaxID=1572659 RepID=A0A4V2M4A6_9ACTN|nr:hypothetical protein [Kribbella capetownensis]TCC35252.1 hypothetical protein E0H75_41430 [Kribbella capetownensis]